MTDTEYNIADEIIALVAICLDVDTPENIRIRLRKELKEIHNEINISIAQLE